MRNLDVLVFAIYSLLQDAQEFVQGHTMDACGHLNRTSAMSPYSLRMSATRVSLVISISLLLLIEMVRNTLLGVT
jgi:hypothetical protein